MSASPTWPEQALLDSIRALSPEEFRAAYAEHLKSHCEHGRPREEHCPWCYVGTDEYRQSVADSMRRWLP